MIIKQQGNFGWPIFFLSILFGISFTTAQARIRIEITEGQASAVPIAVPAFSGEQERNETEDTQTLSTIISQDLKLSGRFSPVESSLLPRGSRLSLAAYPAKEWQKNKIENVVIGEVKNTGNGYQVQVDLLDVFGSSNASGVASSDNINTEAVPDKILSKIFNDVPAKDMRALAHHISDLIFEKLTGIKGIFSTKIAYVLVKPSSDGKKKEYTLEVSDMDGFNAKPLVKSLEPIMSPAWSPDGKKIAYVSFERKRAQIYVIEVFTGRKEKVTQFPGINGAPNWSPDGRQLALVLSKDGNPAIYTIDLFSHTLRRLTQGYSIDTEPSWDPKGGSLYFTSNRGGTPQIYTVSSDGSGKIKRITFKGDYNARPSVTPDGQYLVMQHKGSDGVFKIAKQHLQSGELTVLSQSAEDQSPSLSPNGDMILYGTRSRGQGVLGLVSIAGRGKLRLPAREGVVQEPAWSPYLNHYN
jgi:TolB protein